MFKKKHLLHWLAVALSPIALHATPDWVARSNQLADPLFAVEGRYDPSWAADAGLEQFDTVVPDLAPGAYEHELADLAAQRQRLVDARVGEADSKVRQDIDIVVNHIDQQIETLKTDHQYMVRYHRPAEAAYTGLRTLLDPRNQPARQAHALVLLKRYAGREAGYTPLAMLMRAQMQADLARPGLLGPYVEQVKQDLSNTDRYLDGIAELFKQDKLTGWESDLKHLREQMHEHDAWVRSTLLPHARPDARLPRDVYALRVKADGVSIAPEALMTEASIAFQETRDEMRVLAAQIAHERHLPSSDYRDVIRVLKKEQIPPAALLQAYTSRLHQLEDIIRREDLLTLPKRDAAIRIASEAESAELPSPFMSPPRLIGNTGEFGEFVIPLSNPNAKSDALFDDNSFEGETWTLTAHEGRPGHELQYDAIVERGSSNARILFASNSANVEGWAVYCEAMMLPYMPIEGQLASLQDRLLRISRAFLDPMVNLGQITPAQAKRFLMDEVVESEPMAQSEIDRYAFLMPGQATAYYFGYSRLRGIRTNAELALASHFKLKDFNDFVISQGFLPPDLMRTAVMEEFVPQAAKAAAGS